MHRSRIYRSRNQRNQADRVNLSVVFGKTLTRLVGNSEGEQVRGNARSTTFGLMTAIVAFVGVLAYLFHVVTRPHG